MVFPLIDVLRAFAALSVLVYHLIAHWQWEAFPESGPLAWFREGWMAVDLFFVVSGFVIGLSAFARIDAQGAGFRRGFLRSRLARIVPLHYLALVAYVGLVEPSLWDQRDFWPNFASHLLFVHNLYLPYAGAINGPNWSLATELQFYLLVALAAPWLRTGRPWLLALCAIAVAWSWRWATHGIYGPEAMDKAYFVQTQLPGMLDEFAIGLLLARFVRAPAGQAFLQRLRRDRWCRYALAGVAALGWWALFEVLFAHDYWQQPAMSVFFRTGLAACAGLVLLLLCAWPMPKAPVLLRVPLYLGKISYGIYLWHLPVLFLLHRHVELEPLAALGVAAAATIALAALTWHGFEQPLLRRWGKAPEGGVSQSPRGAPRSWPWPPRSRRVPSSGCPSAACPDRSRRRKPA